MDVLAALDALRAELASVGIRAEHDPRDVNPPGAWLTVDRIEHGSVMCGGGTVHAFVYLVVPDTGAAQATTQLADMLADALRVFDPDGDTVPLALNLTSAGGSLPSYRLSIDVPID